MANPIRTAAGDRVRYAERDTIGVEESGAERGINAELRFTRDMHIDQLAEHTGMGVHSTPKIARAKLIAKWDGTKYVLHARSYLHGVYGSGVASVAADPIVGGLATVTLSTGLGTASYAISDASIDDATPPSPLTPPDMVRTMLVSIASASSFVVRRYSGPDAPGLSGTHGDFTILVYAR